ncbi:MAG: nitrate- and nitrite sensing domain-containing protein, partial [Janthinobacterium lividum]
MPRNLSIRARLLVLLSAPLVLLLIAAVILNVGFINGALQSRRVAVFASSAGGASQLISILQNERLVTVRSLVPGANVDPAELTAARAKTDAAIQAVIKGVGTGNIAGIGPSAKAELTAGYAALASFSGGRAAVDSGNTTAAQTLTGFGAYMDAYSDLSLAVSDDVKDRVMAREEAAFAYLIKEREAASREQAAGLLILSGANSTSVSQIRSNAVAEQNFLGTQAKLVENASLAADVGKVVNTSAAAQARALVASDRNAFSAAGNGTPTVTIDEWMKSTDAVIDSLDKAANVAASYVEDRGETSASDAIFRGVLLGVLTLLVAGGAIAFALRSATGIARRLRALAGAATEVRDELPRMVERMQTPGEGPGATFTPVPVTSNDEIGAVAHVINDLNETTFRIAGEQAALRASIAEMFVNVARRDQSLLARQLAFLDQLERTEENPDTLEDLFTLDHLATRMRRNAESLLVLAGINTGRRL